MKDGTRKASSISDLHDIFLTLLFLLGFSFLLMFGQQMASDTHFLFFGPVIKLLNETGNIDMKKIVMRFESFLL